MTEANKDEKCTVCGGTGVSKPNFNNVEKEKLKYQPLECSKCKGSGKEQN